MIISFANLKGGVGKSKLNAYFSAFLAAKKNHTVCLVDFDASQLTTQVYDVVENPNLTVIPYNPTHGNITNLVMSLNDDYDYVLVDIPGTIQQEGVLPLMSIMDYIVVPTTNEEEDISSSIQFCGILQKLNVKHVVLMNNYEVQFFGMAEHEQNEFKEYSELFPCGVLSKGIRKNRSLLQQNFKLGLYGDHSKTDNVEKTLELIYSKIN